MHPMFRIVFAALALLALTATASLAQQEKIGEVQALDGMAVAAFGEEKRPLTRGADVYLKDTVATGEETFLQIMFKDGTVLALQEDSIVELTDFAYEVGEADQGRVGWNMVSGSLRFLTGQVAKFHPEGFVVETPLGTIGIRGTEGVATTELADGPGFSGGLNQAITAPGTGWAPPAPPTVNKQTVAHVDGSVSKAMTFNDFNNRTVTLARGQAVDVSGETGAGDPREIGPQDRQQMRSVNFSKQASVPTGYRNAFDGFAGGGRPSATSVGDPGGGGNEEPPAPKSTSSSSSCPN